jgi:hypothetical protein
MARLDKVIYDSVSGPDRDRTDWKQVILPGPGRLTVLLHWEQARTKLGLSIHTLMGDKIQDGRVWGTGGLRSVVAVEEPGRYMIRVQAATHRDESRYALRMRFRADRREGCRHCEPGQRRCIGACGYLVCRRVGERCAAWTEVVACAGGCKEGACVGCEGTCSREQRECTDGRSYRTCVTRTDGCPAWSGPTTCPAGQVCRRGGCVGAGAQRHQAPTCRLAARSCAAGTTYRVCVTGSAGRPVWSAPRSCAAGQACKNGGCVAASVRSVRGRIISMYHLRNFLVLHIELGNQARVQPGMRGVVLQGRTSVPLPGGDILVSRVTGRYAIARTRLPRLGLNRYALIHLRPGAAVHGSGFP